MNLGLIICLSLMISSINGRMVGLYSSDGLPMKILSLSSNVYSEGPYAEIEYIQDYYNPLGKPIETIFYFPRTEDSVFHKFEAKFRNRTAVGTILEKEQARTSYEENKKEGNTVAYAEMSNAAPDVMKIMVGNIPAEESVTIKFSIIQPLEIVLNKFWGLHLPSTLTERYASADYKGETLDYQVTDPKTTMIRDWKINILLASDSSFESIQIPSHKLKPHYYQKDNVYFANIQGSIPLNKDFVLYFRNSLINKPELIVAEHPSFPGDFVILVSFLPELNSMSIGDVINMFLEDIPVNQMNEASLKEDLETGKGEFIFIIDRSGSMGGARIENLKKALHQFLISLPKDSYFNILSFGSTYSLYSPDRIQNNSRTLEEVLRWVPHIAADMGGTEILNAVQAVTNLPSIAGYPRTVIFLTDGDVHNADAIIKHVYDNKNSMKFCSVGIGNGISEYLIKNIGKAGDCTSEFVKDSEDIGAKALHILQAAVSRHIENAHMETKCFNADKELIFINQQTQPFLLKNTPFEKFVYIPKAKSIHNCNIKVSYFNSYSKEHYEEIFDIEDFTYVERTDIWHKLAYHKKIQELTFQSKSSVPSETQAITMDIVALSTKYQVLSQYTAFLTVIQQEKFNPSEPISIELPVARSIDYYPSYSGSNQASGTMLYLSFLLLALILAFIL